MKQKPDRFSVLFAVVLLLFCLIMILYVPATSMLRFQLEDVSISLETSQGRERKQQHELDEVLAELPLLRAELADTQPQAEAALQEVADLKAARKALRAEIKQLEETLASQSGSFGEDAGHE